MLKKLINHSENNQVEMNDSALRDIIPSNDILPAKKVREKRFTKICQIILVVFILGILTVGIVALALILTLSGKSFMSYVIHSSEGNLLSVVHQQNSTTEQNWKKITLNVHETTQRSLPVTKIKEESTDATLTTEMSSTMKKKLIRTKYRQLQEDQSIDDLLNA